MIEVKRLSRVLAAVLVLLCVCLPVFAETGTYVADEAGVFSSEEFAELERKAEDIGAQYGIGVYIITTADYQKLSAGNDIWDCAKAEYESRGFGLGSGRNGVLFLISMSDRGYALDVNGTDAHYAVNDDGQDLLEDHVLEYFRRDAFYDGFNSYLDTCENLFRWASEGDPYTFTDSTDYYEEPADHTNIIAAVVCGAVAAGITGLLMSSSMRSAGIRGDADAYKVAGSLELRRQSDMFLHRSVTRIRRQRSSDGHGGDHGGGGHGMHHSSGGHSGRSGHF